MKKYIIVDIDGTLAVPNPERMKHAHVDWEAFYADSFDDEPIKEMVDLVKHLHRKYEVVYCTARSERARVKTLNWFDKHELTYENRNILMRPNFDERSSVEIKLDLLKWRGIKVNQIALMFDDHNAIVRVFRSLGVVVLQPGSRQE